MSDRDGAFESGTQIDLRGLHDSTLSAIEWEKNRLALRFECEEADEGTISLEFARQRNLVVWAEGVVFPLIVSAVSTFGVVEADTRMDILSPAGRARLLSAAGDFGPVGWCVLVAPSFGQALAVLGTGDLLGAFQVVRRLGPDVASDGMT
jgi:hypothetical protein